MSDSGTRLETPRPRNTSISDFPFNRDIARVALIAFGRSISDSNDFMSDLDDWIVGSLVFQRTGSFGCVCSCGGLTLA
jgi:hypothetical protein